MKKIERLIYRNSHGDEIEFSHESVFFTQEASGLSVLRNTIYSVSAMGQEGASYVGHHIESRNIDIDGFLRVYSRDEAIPLRRQLTSVLNPQLPATLTYRYGDFVRVIDCKVESTPKFSKSTSFAAFSCAFVCIDPFWREENESKDMVASWVGGLEFEAEIPYENGMEIGFRNPARIVNVHNAGDVEAGARIVFTACGTASNPEILNVETGEFLRFNNITMLVGDSLSVCTAYGQKMCTLTQSGVTIDAFRFLDVDSTYFQLATGDNLLRYAAASGEDNIEVAVYHSNRYLGV